MNLIALTHVVAEAVGYPVPTAMQVARLGREAGVLCGGGRGRHVPQATKRDAANLLIAFVAAPSTVRAVEYMVAFGELEVSLLHAGPSAKPLLPAGTKFRDGIATALALLGDKEFARSFDVQKSIGAEGLLSDQDSDISPVIDVTIADTMMEARIAIDEYNTFFVHPAVNRMLDLAPRSRAFRDAYRDSEAAAAAFHSKIKSERRVEIDVLLPIAAALNGKTFLQLLIETHPNAAGRKVG